MALKNEQLPVLKIAILAETDPIVVTALSAGNFAGVSDWYNEAGTFVAWKTVLSEHDITNLTSPEATTWDWTAYIATSVAEKMAWERMFNGSFTINPSIPQVRAGIADIFNGPSGADQRAHLLATAKRNSLRGEALFAIGTGTTGDPGNLVYEGTISVQNVTKALNLP